MSSDRERVRQIADGLQCERLFRWLDAFPHRFPTIRRSFGVEYHWSADGGEYSTDIVLGKRADL
jgi:hypothetical protein